MFSSKFVRPIVAASKRAARVPSTTVRFASNSANRNARKAAPALGAIAFGAAALGLGGGLAYAASPNAQKFTGTSALDIPLGNQYPYILPVVVESSQGSREKYEMDGELKMIKMRKVIRSAVFFPHNYGFIPQTQRRQEMQPLDVMIMGGDELIPGCVVDVRPLGYIMMEDEEGVEEKLLAVVESDPRYKDVRKLRDVPEHFLREISHFFETYLALENKQWKKIGGWRGTDDAIELIEEAHLRYSASKQQVKDEVRRFSTRR